MKTLDEILKLKTSNNILKNLTNTLISERSDIEKETLIQYFLKNEDIASKYIAYIVENEIPECFNCVNNFNSNPAVIFLKDKRLLHLLEKMTLNLKKNDKFGYVKKGKFDDINDLLIYYDKCKRENLELPSFDDIYNKIKKFSIHDMLWKASQFDLLDDTKFIKTLIDNGKDIHENNDEMLRYVSTEGYPIVVKYLLENGANIHANDDESLRLSAQMGYFEVVKLLVENGADIHADNDHALRTSANNRYGNVVKYLIEHGANIHANNEEALRKCAEYDCIELVKYLIDNGADKTVLSSEFLNKYDIK